MSTTTTNYGLIKPDTTDPILIGQLNDNSDAIDAALKENADAIENKPDAADIPTPSTAAPAMDGTAAAGTSTNYARADHIHPSDTSKQDALTTSQLAAANSGIDSTKVAQIEINKNNILKVKHADDTNLYFAETEPTGTIPTGSYWISKTATKVYGRTDNQFDKDTMEYDLTYIYVSAAESYWAKAATSGITVRIPCSPNQQYTLSISGNSSIFRIATVATSDIPIAGNVPVSATILVNDTNINQSTITTPNNAMYILFQAAAADYDMWINSLMCNTGSSALPYVPYLAWQ